MGYDAMTESEKQTEIAARITRLNEIRADLVVARSRLQRGLRRLAEAAYLSGATSGGELRWRPGEMGNQPVEPWPSKDELDDVAAKIGTLEGEADALTRELAGLGLDAGLFRLRE